jgi:hypothetical protein
VTFRQPGNEAEKLSAAKKILTNRSWNEEKNLFPVLESLKVYSGSDQIPEIVNARIKSIIEVSLSNMALNKNRNFYFGLMSIPFHQDRIWKVKSEYIISNWDKLTRRAITSVLHSYFLYPTSTSIACKSILENWKTEIIQPIYQVYGRLHYGDHIRIALGHPGLRDLAKTIAYEIVRSKEIDSMDIPDYLVKIVKQIINEDIYPKWISENADEYLPE